MADGTEVQLELVETIAPVDAPAAVTNPQPDDMEAPAVAVPTVWPMSADYLAGFQAGQKKAYDFIAANYDPYIARPILDLKPD